MSIKSDGSTASYYELPNGCTELQHIISYRDMNAQIGEIFRACYRYGQASHSDKLRDAKKIAFYAMAEIERLEKLQSNESDNAIESEWIVWTGGDMAPVHSLQFVEVMLRAGDVETARASAFDWAHHGSMSDIVTYRKIIAKA